MTFPFPMAVEDDEMPHQLEEIGRKYEAHRTRFMHEEVVSLTTTYNHFHDPVESGTDIIELRRLHVEMDYAVAAAYGWQALDLGHEFHETKQGTRYTVSEAARREVLDRLLALNHQRHAEEEAENAALPVSASGKRGRKPKDTGGQITMDL